ncbi:hypothetical protein V2J09_008932 [Rumex salicifolius]
MKKIRWAMDGDFWDMDLSTAQTLDGVARPVAHLQGHRLLPLGLSRGTKLSRPKQIDFFQRFMAAPFLPCFSFPRGFSLQRALTLPFGNDWFVTLLGQFDLLKFLSSINKNGGGESSKSSSWMQKVKRDIRNKSYYALGFFSELLITPDDTLLLSCDTYGDTGDTRKKAFPNHELIMEAVSPALVMDEHATFWDVPLMMAIDLASVAAGCGPSYHLSMHHISGSAKQFEGNNNQISAVPCALHPGLSLKAALALNKNVDLWRSQSEKLKLVQPYDILISDPHVSASGIIGSAVATASLGKHSLLSQTDDEPQSFKHFRIRSLGKKSAALADVFGSLSFSAQHGNFQKFFFDLSRLHVRLDFASGSKVLSAAAHLGQDLYSSRDPNLEAIQALIPTTTLSLQQQIIGPFSIRVDSTVAVELDSTQKWQVRLEKPVFAIEHALQVLGSAKATAWFAPEQKQFMVELRFFET